MITDRVPALLEPIQNRLNAATDAAAVPWEAVGTGVQGGDHWYVCAEGQSIASIACDDGENEEQREPLARFFAAAPTDQTGLLAAVKAVMVLADQWTERGEHLISYSKTAPEDVADGLADQGYDFTQKAAFIRTAVESALGGGA